MSERFMVTGGAGFIGSHLVSELNARGHQDICVVDDLDNDIKRENLDRTRYAEYIDKKEFRESIRSGKQGAAAAMFHLGACSSTTETNEEYLRDNNFEYTREMCQWCLSNGVRFIYASSAATYGDGSLGYRDDDGATPTLKPLNPYGVSKQMFDMWALEKGLLDRIAGLKYFNVYGPRERHKGDMRSMVHKSCEQIQATGKVRLFKSYEADYADGEQDRDFVYVCDAVKATLFFYEHAEVSGLFNCGTGVARTWLDLAEAVFKAMGKEKNIEFIEMPESIRDQYQYHTQAEMTKLRGVGFGDEFTSLEDGVSETVKSLLS